MPSARSTATTAQVRWGDVAGETRAFPTQGSVPTCAFHLRVSEQPV